MTEEIPKEKVCRCILRYTLNRVPVAISTARIAIRVADCRSMIAIHVTRMIFEQDFKKKKKKKKKTREIIRGIFLLRGNQVQLRKQTESFFLFNENDF